MVCTLRGGSFFICDMAGFFFKDKMYLGRIKTGNQGYDDDIIGCLLHDVGGGMSHSSLARVCREEGF